ncbi:MAG: orotidine 5'-phosphate decarboxylase [Patescibacteria group bacterium]|nr:orotidine 5'-phosphate decarboxylase [Patescibacteria group bacterium]
MIKLQVALDFIDLEKALEMASKVVNFCDVLEAGTPLIKSYGMESVRQLKKSFPEKEIFADLKTMDAGALEVGLAQKAGASFASVMACSSDTTIKSSLTEAKKTGISAVFDLMGTSDKIKRAKELEQLRVQYLHVHSGLDEQSEGQNPWQTLSQISQAVSVNLTVAGGINVNNIERILKVPKVAIIMVGSSITKSVNPDLEAKKMYDVIRKEGF